MDPGYGGNYHHGTGKAASLIFFKASHCPGTFLTCRSLPRPVHSSMNGAECVLPSNPPFPLYPICCELYLAGCYFRQCHLWA